MPGDYVETHAGTAAVRVTKSIKLIAMSDLPDVKVRILPAPGQTDGILIEPENPGDPDVKGVTIKGFTVEGFPNNGIWLRHVKRFRIEGNETIDNLENGIFPTLSASGLVKKNVSYGSQDSALWVEGSENVRVIGNDLHHSPTGLEITVSKNITARKNRVYQNTIGIGLYHPSAASLPPLGDDGDWEIVDNDVFDNNQPNSAPPGSMAAELPSGGGILVLGVDRVTLEKNQVANNDFFGVAVIDYCLAVSGSGFDCNVNPPEVEPAPNDNLIVKNFVSYNAANPSGPFAPLAADILVLGGSNNCFLDNIADYTFPALLPSC
jgi:parallel beta-helix repeat protein